ncbi:uncharacterized protein [Primulina huaijiensis]|uniref:uncharacterized protein n=1 Tax=Primulina huaijiensis TaxID=1492673 RepID=UPI003CC6ED10
MGSKDTKSSVTSESSWLTQKCIKIVEEKRIKWFSTKERITELVSNVNISNVREIGAEISKEDLFEGRGVFCQEIMKSQMNSPRLTNVYAALVAIINSNFPDLGLLLVKRVLLKLKDEYNYDGRSGNMKRLRVLSKFLAHFVNQLVVYPLLANDVCLFLMGNPNSDHVEVAVKFCIECGSTFKEFLPIKFRTVLQEFHRVCQEVEIERSVRFLILMLFKIQRRGFRDYPGMIDELNLVKIRDQQIHQVSMLHVLDPESSADDFEVDPHDFCGIDDSSDDDDDEDEDEVSSQKH